MHPIRVLIPLTAAVAITGGAYFVLPRNISQPPAPVAMGHRVVAAINIQQGAVLAPGMVELQAVPQTMITAQDLTSLSQAIGQVTQAELTAGEALRGEDVEPPQSAGVVYQISPGKRAMTIAVTDTSGVDFRLLPNERVDVLWVPFAASATGSGAGAASTVAASSTAASKPQVILSNLRVLALGPPTPATAQTNLGTGSTTTNYASVTLAVTPVQAAQLAAAQAQGQVVLLARRVGKNGRAKLEYPVGGPTG